VLKLQLNRPTRRNKPRSNAQSDKDGDPSRAPTARFSQTCTCVRFVLGWKMLGHESRLCCIPSLNYDVRLMTCVICCRAAEEALASMRDNHDYAKVDGKMKRRRGSANCRKISSNFLGYTFWSLLSPDRAARLGTVPSKSWLIRIWRSD